MKYALTLLLSLAGCAQGGGLGPGASCALVKQADVPVVYQGQLPVVAVTINGKPTHLVLDTGAQTTVLAETAREKFGLPDDSSMRTELAGVGNYAGRKNSFIETFQLGNITLHNLSKVAVPLRFAAGITADGYLGSDLLGEYDVDLDLPHQHVTLYAGRNCPQVRPDWTATADLLPAAPLHRALPANFVSAEVDGHAGTAAVDTGAAFSVIDRQFAATLGVTDTSLQADRQRTAIGTGVNTSKVWLHRFESFTIGAEKIARPNLVVAELPSLNLSHYFQFLIGEDYLRTHRVWISYPGYQVYAAPARRP